jgi:alditol oxidase
VRALEYVDASGELARVERGDADFPALAVGLGAFGIVTRVTLAIEPSYLVRQTVAQGLTWDELLADPPAITGSAYSVSVFTMWEGDVAGDVWRKSVIDPARQPLDGFEQLRTPVVPLAGSTENLTPQNGAPGAWCEQLPHFRLDSTPSFGDEIQSEYFVARADAVPALTAVRALAAEIAPHLVVSELRTASADDLWLSGAFERDTLAIHFTWRKRPAEVRALLPRIEAALAPFAPRPHWGKWHTIGADDVRARLPRLGDARAVFERLDPDGRFANDHLRRLGLR